jgi:uncharacterized protein (DUF1810 family)
MNAHGDSIDRFVQAQRLDYETALAELRAGLKRSHWIWYVLPQLRGLGFSDLAHEYGISGQEEAVRYCNHPVLGPRLIECINAVLQHSGTSVVAILGEIDALKFRSCLTLFSAVAPHEPCFEIALRTFYSGIRDPETLKLLQRGAGAA